MIEGLETTSVTTRILAALRELVVALDRRVSHSERPGEQSIAGDSRKLRREAVARIQELTRTSGRTELYDRDLVDAVMTDDGGPIVPSRLEARSEGRSFGSRDRRG